MEADKVTEEPHTTKDAKEHPSSKDPSAEDLQELPISEPPLGPSIPQTLLEPQASEALFVPSSQTPLESHVSEGLLEPSSSETPSELPISEPPLVPSTSQIPLEPQASEYPLVPATSQTLLELQTSESPSKPSISAIPLETSTSETHISEVPEKYLSSQSSSISSISVLSFDALREDFSELSSNEVPQTRWPTQVSEFEHLPEHSLPGPSFRVPIVTSSKQKEEAEEDEQSVDTSDLSVHTAQPGHHLGKKKKRVSCVYIRWRCPHYLWDCFQIGEESKCFCGHLLKEHQIISDTFVPCTVSQCRCPMFCFIPSRPEEVGEFWVKRRATFDPKAWRAQYRCKHSHEEHAVTGTHPCRHHGSDTVNNWHRPF
ncbi:protein FAM221B isoform X2 [Castor canadensis]|uniref:Protein FAM221B isoform X2 n=1 Tax=Castor canadensis TaxID=51338 RepID=A0AC58KRP3_CASCN